MKGLKDSFSTRPIDSDAKEPEKKPEVTSTPVPTQATEKAPSVYIPKKPDQKVVFYQATARGSTAILADGSKERLPAKVTEQTTAVTSSAPQTSTPRTSAPQTVAPMRTPTRPARPMGSRMGGRPGEHRNTRRQNRISAGTTTSKPAIKRTYNKFTPDGKPKLRIIPAGGVEEIGKNMTIFEYGDDIIVVDMGLSFPDTDMLGVDFVIPDATYLVEHKANIRGAVITHGHLDHIGAIPYMIEKIGFPRMYCSDVTAGLIKLRLEEHGIVAGDRMQVVSPDGDSIQLGVFKVNFFRLNHSIPGAMGLEIETPAGNFVYATDWKFDYTPADGKPASFQYIAGLGGKGIKVLFSDSTNAEKPGHTISEAVVEQALIGIIQETKGRIIIAMFSTLINRMQQVINAAHKNGRMVLVVGRSMQQSLEMAIGIKAVTIPPNTLLSERQARNIDDSKLVILSTGAQGEDRAALSRMAKGEHKMINIKRGDTVVISASPIPGNERSVSHVMDLIYKAGGHVIYNKQLDIHTSGHGSQEDLKLMIALTKPEYFVPIHGERHKLILHAKLAQELGVDRDKCIISSDGQVIECLPDGKIQITDEYIPNGYVMVDGLGVGDVGNIVIRDRQAMAQNGMLVAIGIVERKSGKLVTSPDIISRGFIYMRESEDLVNDARSMVRKIITESYEGGKQADMSEVKERMRRELSRFLFKRTEREPMVIAVLKEV